MARTIFSARRARSFFSCEQEINLLFFISIMVVNADEWAGEGEYLAEGYQYAVVYLAQWRANEPRKQ